jgi:CheY-like chemotaxis protein
VLIIDDNQDTADALAMLLSVQGYEVATASSGPEGVEQSRRWLPWAILCDLGLPGCDGFEVARRVRAEPATALVRLICVSGYDQEEDRRQALAAGFDVLLVKPVEPAELLHQLSQE